jgi:hypothetical protein
MSEESSRCCLTWQRIKLKAVGEGRWVVGKLSWRTTLKMQELDSRKSQLSRLMISNLANLQQTILENVC